MQAIEKVASRREEVIEALVRELDDRMSALITTTDPQISINPRGPMNGGRHSLRSCEDSSISSRWNIDRRRSKSRR